MDETATTTDWYGPDVATFGDRVAAAREHEGMTQAQLAKRIGVRLNTLKGWEDDLNEPRAYRLNRLAGMLSVSMMWLLTGEGQGVESPAEATPEVGDLLSEIRELKMVLLSSSERLGRLEKKLRQRAAAEPAE